MSKDITDNQTANDQKITNALANIDAPPIDGNAKTRALNLAMAEFSVQEKESSQENNENIHQGFWSWLRPTDNNHSSNSRTSIMDILKNKLFYSGGATLSLAIVGSFLFYQTDDATHINISPEEIKELAVVKEASDLRAKKSLDNKSSNVSNGHSAKLETIASAQQEMKEKLMPAEASSPPVPQMPNSNADIDVSTIASNSHAVRTQMAEDVATVSVLPRPMMGAPQTLSKSAPLLPHKRDNANVDDLVQPVSQAQGRDRFEHIEENPVKLVSQEPVSTFSADVDTASYSFMRRQLNRGVLPQKEAVRIEEIVNYFDYTYSLPDSKKQPFKPSIVVQPAPWSEGKQLVHIGIKGYDIPDAQQPRSNIVLLLDVSGSMSNADKLPLVKQSMSLLLNSLKPDDTVAIVVYAGAAGKVLEPTPVKEKQKILDALKRLNAGGSTAGGQGIKLAYELAEANFSKGAVNRIILATDGDFNVGINSRDELKGFVERKRNKGIFLSVLGFGQGNYNDHMMQSLAQHGNGVAAYIDSLSEAQKILVDEATSTLFPIAQDVKLQVEFNPQLIAEYRLMGYETRALKQEDFNNDKVDAGDIGAGHSVTAIYEVTPVNSAAKLIDVPRYSGNTSVTNGKSSKVDVATNKELGFLKIRYKLPDEEKSRLISQAIYPMHSAKTDVSTSLKSDANFATAVAAFAQLLKGGKHIGTYQYDDIIRLAQANKGVDTFGYRSEFIQLVRKAKTASALP